MKMQLSFCLAFILLASSTTAETDTKAIAQFSIHLMRMDRMDISCNGKLNENEISTYYSEDFMKRMSKSCEASRREGIAGSLFYTGFLDGNSPSLCHENINASAPCYSDYKIEKILTQGDDKADVTVTYNHGEFFYTILKLVRENGRWRLDDISLVDPNTKGTDYDESHYSIKSEIDKEISRIEKKSDSVTHRARYADPTP